MPDPVQPPFSGTASQYRIAGVLEDHVRHELQEVLWIYETGFPGFRLRILARQGDDAVGAPPQVHDRLTTIEPSHLSDRFLGMIEGGSEAVDAPPLVVVVTIPRRPNPGEELADGPAWRPPRRLTRLFGASPMTYERIRYAHERRQEMRGRRHRWTPMQFSTGAPLFAPAVPVSNRAPALLIALHWLEVGGAEKLALDCIRWARDLGFRVFVVSQLASVGRLAASLPDDVRFIRLDRYLPAAHWGPFLERLVWAENIRMIHIHHCVGAYGALAHLRVTCPWLEVMDSTHVVEYADGGYVRVSGVWSSYIDHHHVISRQLAALYRDRFGAGGKVRLGRMIPDGMAQVEPPVSNLRAGKDGLRVAFVGRLYYQKRPITVLLMMRAIADWAKKNKVSVGFDFVGDGPFAEACHRLAGRLGLREMLTFHPSTTDVPALLAETDVLLLPSSNEGLALVCYEAIRAGVIPVCTDVGAQNEIVPAGLLTPRDPARAVRSAVGILDRLWRDQAVIDSLTKELHERYRTLQADPTAEAVISDIYRMVLEKARQDAA